MIMEKITWVVQPAPTGQFRSFHYRAWPSACVGGRDGKTILRIKCEDVYNPRKVKTGDHKPLQFAYTKRIGKASGWDWYVIKQKFATLAEVKKAAEDFYRRHPDLFINDDGSSIKL